MVRSLLLLALCCVALVGCGSDGGYESIPPQVTGAPISGKLLTGTLPVSGAHVYLMAVAAAGYGKPSVPLLDAGSTGFQDSVGAYVVTATDGSFTIPGYYSCSAQTDVYIYTSGGDSGLGQNSAATELAAIGPCPQVGAAVPPMIINEVTTVAMSFALAGFANDAQHVASSGSQLALTGVANAFVNASHLGPTTTGVAPATLPSGNATVPQTTINTLANILSSCIHSTGAGSSSCQSLLVNAGSALVKAGSAPPLSDTASAMIAIAHSPASGVSALFAQQSSTAPFSPYLTTVPNDFSLGLVFTGGGMNLTSGMAVDAMGNIWSTNDSYYITEISSEGNFLSGSNGYFSGAYFPGPVALDLNGNVWIGNGAHSINGPGSLFELSNDGTVLSGANGYGYGLLRRPEGIAIDASNNIWVADTVSDTVAEFSNSGQVLSGMSGFTGGGISNPNQLAISASNSIWITNSTTPSISEISGSGVPLTPSTGVIGTGFVGGASLALDHQNTVWTVGAGPGAQVSKVSPSGVILSGSGYATVGVGGTHAGGTTIAIDGDGNVWVPLYFSPYVIELSNSGATLSGATGYTGGIATEQANLVIDGSGDVWGSTAIYTPPTMRGAPGVYTWEIVEMIGIAAPVVTPIAEGVKLNMLGARP